MHDLMENEVPIVGQDPRFPFCYTLDDTYVVSEPSWVAEEPSAKLNESGQPSLSYSSHLHGTRLSEVKRIDPRKENVRVQALQRWTGRVETVMKDRFLAVVSDITTPSNPDEEVELDIEDVPSGDHALITKGAVFYWAIVYRDSKAGQRLKAESIRFARHPKLGEGDVREIFREADAITAILESA
jgi:hypothetical protein